LREKVVFAYDLPSRREVYEIFDIFVEPAHREGLGHDLLEAMARGLPAVVTAAGSVFGTIEDGTSGLLVPPGDYETLARVLDDLLASPERRRSLGEAGRATVLARHGLDPFVEAFSSLYDDAIAAATESRRVKHASVRTAGKVKR
jgi:glycosyltransferase involved in cell wall biosynthesis